MIAIFKKFKLAMWLLLLMSFLEKFYLDNYATGHFNKYLLVLFCLIGIVLFNWNLINKNLIKNWKQFITLENILLVLFLPYIVFRKINIYSYTYTGTFIMMFIWGKSRLPKANYFFKGLILIGISFAVLERTVGDATRSFGFLINSATLFSLLMVVSATYILMKKEKLTLSEYLLLIAAFVAITLSKTRSSMLLFVFIAFLRLVEKNKHLLNKENLIKILTNRKVRIVLSLSLIVLIIIFFFVFKKILFRPDGHESIADRKNVLYGTIFNLLSNPLSMIFGYGPGSSVAHAKSLTLGYSITFVHQDILALFYEYGFVGIILILNFLKSLKLKKVVILIMLIATFHNGIYFAPLMLSLMILNESIKEGTYES